jgi:uncharacterized membrane protein (Fun14 family)
MSIPPEIAWLIPIVVPFVIGLLVGAIIKHGFKILILVVALIVILVATGVVSLSFSTLFDEAMKFLPRLYDIGAPFLNLLPYMSITFLIGLVIGLLKA